MMEYKGYLGNVEYDDEAGVFHGDVVNTRDVITFEGESVAQLRRAFKESVEDYLEMCAKRGEAPDKPYSGQFVTRVSPELHRKISLTASVEQKSLNAWIAEKLQAAVSSSTASSRKKASATKSSGKVKAKK